MPITEFRDESVTKKVLSIEVPAEKAREATDAALRFYRSRATLPGFRKGKVPESMIRKNFAEEIERDVLEKLIPGELFGALKDKGLETVVPPKVSDIHFHDGEPLRFQATVEVRPPIELGVYRGLTIPPFSAEPTPEEVDKSLADLAEPMAQYIPVESRRASRGDFVVADINGHFPGGDGEPFENPKVFLELGNDKNFPGINDLVPGSEAGAKVEFDHTFEADFPNGDMAGKTVHYAVKVLEIKEKQLPAVDDDFAKNSGLAETAEELRQKVTDAVRRRKEDFGRHVASSALLDKLRETHSFEIPEGLVEEEVEETLKRIAVDLARGGMDPEKAGVDWNKMKGEAREPASKRVADRLILDAIATKEGIEATDTEMDAEVRRLARQTKREPAELKHDLEHRGLLSELAGDIRRAKVIKELIDSAHRG